MWVACGKYCILLYRRIIDFSYEINQLTKTRTLYRICDNFNLEFDVLRTSTFELKHSDGKYVVILQVLSLALNSAFGDLVLRGEGKRDRSGEESVWES